MGAGENLDVEGEGGAVSWLDGRRGGVRVVRRARSWPVARGAVGFRGRGRRPPLVAEGRALRADTKRRGAPFTKARVRGTRKRPSRLSRHENASPCSRISTCCEGRKTTDFTDWRGFLDKWKSEKSSALSSHFVKWRGECRGDGPRWVVHESSQIDTNFVHIREIRVDSWTATSARAHLALVHLGDRERGGAISCLDGRRGGISCRPQGAFVAGGARRRRLSWSRPQAAMWQRVGRFARTRNGAVCRSRKPACAGHESVRVGRRNTKTLRHVLESQLAVAKDAGLGERRSSSCGSGWETASPFGEDGTDATKDGHDK